MAESVYMQKAVQYFVHRGYRIQSQSDNQVQLLKPKNSSCWFIGFLFLLGILPGIFYLMVAKDKSVLLTDVGNGIQSSYNNKKAHFVSYEELDAGKYRKLYHTGLL